jgi:hypothetical protein
MKLVDVCSSEEEGPLNIALCHKVINVRLKDLRAQCEHHFFAGVLN